MVVSISKDYDVTQRGLYEVGFKYRTRIIDWFSLLFNPLQSTKMRFKVSALTSKREERFSTFSSDVPHVSLFKFTPNAKVVLVELLPGEKLVLEVKGDFDVDRLSFFIKEPGTFRVS